MRTCKKLVALVMALAMLATMFAFSASAAEGDTLQIVASGDPVVGENYEVSVKVVDADDSVGGVSGVITVENATLSDVAVNEKLLADNKTEDKNTIVKVEGNSFKFAAVGNDGEWFKLTLTGFEAEATIKVTASDVKASNATGSETTSLVVENFLKVVPTTDTGINVSGTSIRETKDVTEQGMRYAVTFDDDFDFSQVTEVGVIYAPKQLVDMSNFTIGADEDIKVVKAASTDAIFDYIKSDKAFNAYIMTGIADDKAGSYKMLGVRVAARAYYKIGDKVYYSNNNEDAKEITSGIAGRAVLNAAMAMAATKTSEFADKDQYSDNTRRQALIDYVCDNF